MLPLGVGILLCNLGIADCWLDTLSLEDAFVSCGMPDVIFGIFDSVDVPGFARVGLGLESPRKRKETMVKSRK